MDKNRKTAQQDVGAGFGRFVPEVLKIPLDSVGGISEHPEDGSPVSESE